MMTSSTTNTPAESTLHLPPDYRNASVSSVDVTVPKVDGPRLVDLPRVTDERGNLTFVEGQNHLPFDIRRVYYLYDVPGGESRGGHAHRELEALIIAVSGSFDVVVDDGFARDRFTLNRSYTGLYIPRLTWRDLENFSSGSVCLVLASDPYDEADYIRNYDEFRLVAAHEAT